MRRRALVLMTAALTMGALTLGPMADAGASVGSAKAPACAGKTKKKAVKAIKVAFDYFLNGPKGYSTEEKAAYIEDMDTDADLKALLVAGAEKNAAAAGTTSVKVVKVACTGKKSADVTYDLTVADTGEPLLPGQAGDAVLVGKTWKISRRAFCDLTGLGDATVLESGPCAA